MRLNFLFQLVLFTTATQLPGCTDARAVDDTTVAGSRTRFFDIITITGQKTNNTSQVSIEPQTNGSSISVRFGLAQGAHAQRTALWNVLVPHFTGLTQEDWGRPYLTIHDPSVYNQITPNSARLFVYDPVDTEYVVWLFIPSQSNGDVVYRTLRDAGVSIWSWSPNSSDLQGLWTDALPRGTVNQLYTITESPSVGDNSLCSIALGILPPPEGGQASPIRVRINGSYPVGSLNAELEIDGRRATTMKISERGDFKFVTYPPNTVPNPNTGIHFYYFFGVIKQQGYGRGILEGNAGFYVVEGGVSRPLFCAWKATLDR